MDLKERPTLRVFVDRRSAQPEQNVLDYVRKYFCAVHTRLGDQDDFPR